MKNAPLLYLMQFEVLLLQHDLVWYDQEHFLASIRKLKLDVVESVQ